MQPQEPIAPPPPTRIAPSPAVEAARPDERMPAEAAAPAATPDPIASAPPAPAATPARPAPSATPATSAPRPEPRHPQPNGAEHHDAEPGERGATGPQLRRFIKSRAYVPMHELRRRFVINGADDEVTPVDLGERRRIFVGLPEREGRLLGELLRGGDIGYELSLDPISPIVVGVYPMRPVTRA
jgi:hypothetical protein